jgi:hypothetical protein
MDRRYSLYDAPLEKWITILRLASLWKFPRIGDFAVSFIDKLSLETVRKIKIYQDYKVPRRHLLPLYIELATRDKMLEVEEFRVLDAETLFPIVRAREMLRAPPPADGDRESLVSAIRMDCTEEEKIGVVAVAFGLSPEEAQAYVPSA